MLPQNRPDVGSRRRHRPFVAIRVAAVQFQSKPEDSPQLVQRPQVRAHSLPRRHRYRRPRLPRRG